MVSAIGEEYAALIIAAIREVTALDGRIEKIADGAIDIAPIEPAREPMAGKMVLSPEAVSIIDSTIKKGAAAATLAEALEIGYEGFGAIACTEAAREGISAFLEKRKPNFKK